MSSDPQSPLPENHATPPRPPEDKPADAIPIGELVTREDYPQCMVGQTVEIRGIVGQVIQLAGQSLKIRQAEGRTQSFNVHVLRKLYAPLVQHQPIAGAPASRPSPAPLSSSEGSQASDRGSESEAELETEARTPTRLTVANPDFNAPLVSIVTLLQQADFPRSALGAHVDIGGYTGVVVEVANQSLRVLSPEGQRRNYNGPALRKLYAGK